jgi:hypothetical protein
MAESLQTPSVRLVKDIAAQKSFDSDYVFKLFSLQQ